MKIVIRVATKMTTWMKLLIFNYNVFARPLYETVLQMSGKNQIKNTIVSNQIECPLKSLSCDDWLGFSFLLDSCETQHETHLIHSKRVREIIRWNQRTISWKQFR